MNDATVRSLLDKAKYKFAKTMPWNPHYYTLKETWENPDEYQEVIAYILDHGEIRKWGKQKPRPYFDHNGWRYWPMTNKPEESRLLNCVDIKIDKSIFIAPSINDQGESAL